MPPFSATGKVTKLLFIRSEFTRAFASRGARVTCNVYKREKDEQLNMQLGSTRGTACPLLATWGTFPSESIICLRFEEKPTTNRFSEGEMERGRWIEAANRARAESFTRRRGRVWRAAISRRCKRQPQTTNDTAHLLRRCCRSWNARDVNTIGPPDLPRDLACAHFLPPCGNRTSRVCETRVSSRKLQLAETQQRRGEIRDLPVSQASSLGRISRRS